MLGGVCKSGVQPRVAYFVWLWWLFVVHLTPKLYRFVVCCYWFLLYLIISFFICLLYTSVCISFVVCSENSQGICY